MPTIVTQGGPQRPSGLDKFLNTLGGLTGAAEGVANIITLPRRLRLQEAQVASAEATGQRAQQSLDIQEAATERELAAANIQQTILDAFDTRNGLFDIAEAGGFPPFLNDMNGPVDPAVRGAAVSLGDVPFSQREQARKNLAIILGRDISTISDRTVLSEENLQIVLDRAAQQSDIDALRDDPEGFEAQQDARRAQEASGVAGATGADLTRNKRLDEALNNELFRLDPSNGDISGAGYFSPEPLIRAAMEQNGIDWPIETHIPLPDGTTELVLMPVAFRDEVYRAYIDQIIGQENTANTKILEVAADLSKRATMPLDIATNIVTANFEAMSPEELQRWAPIVEGFRNMALVAATTLRNTNPFVANLADQIDLINGMGFPEDERALALNAFQTFLTDQFPDTGLITIRNLGLWDRALARVPAGQGDPGPVGFGLRGAQPLPETGGDGGELIDFGTALEGSNNPALLAADMSTALTQVIEPQLRLLVGVSPEVEARFFERWIEEGIDTPSGTQTVDDADIAMFREFINSLREGQGN